MVTGGEQIPDPGHRPHWFQEVLTAVEIVVPAVFFGIADADGKAELRVDG